MSSQTLITKRPAAWDDEDDFVSVQAPLERVAGSTSPIRGVARNLLQEGIAEEVLDEAALVLESIYRFNPIIRFGEDDGRAYLWLPELVLDADGADFDEAAAELVNEVLTYVDEWERGLSAAPNHARNRGWVKVIQFNRTPDRVYKLLFGE